MPFMRANADPYASTRGVLYAASVEANNLSRTKRFLLEAAIVGPDYVCVNARRCCLLNKVSLLGAAQKLQHVSAGNWAHQSQPLFE